MVHSYFHRQTQGVSLLEMMLVLAIAASLILAGLNTYRAFETDKDYFILKSNVDFLFVAMKNFYQQECDFYFATNGDVYRNGKLIFAPGNYAPVAFDVTTTSQFISANWPRYIPVVADGDVASTYVAQFNPDVGGVKKAYACFPDSTGKPVCETPTTITNSSIILWQSQIAVKMKDPSKTTYYLAKAGADCAVNSISTTTAVDCATTGLPLGTSANYMVWQRMPSFSSANVVTSHWVSNPAAKIFKLQYTHDPMYELYNSNASSVDAYKFYLCGG